MSINFLICSERSGSNLITKILNSHSNICGPSPKHIFNPVLRNLFRYNPLNKDRNWNELLIDIYRLINVNFSTWKKTFSFEELSELSKTGDINNLLRNIFYTEAKENGKQHIFVKENHVYEYLPYLILNFPESKYLYQVRDPRDMALSWKKSKIHVGGIVNGARQWQKDQQNSLKHYFPLKEVRKIKLFKYEDLITTSDIIIKEVIEFLGYQFEEEMLDFHKENLANKNSKRMESWKNLSKPLLKKNMKKYQNELNEGEIKTIERICYFEMKFLGYEPEFGLSDLKKITTDKLNEIDKKEKVSIELDRPEGVIKNIEAKKAFYNKLI